MKKAMKAGGAKIPAKKTPAPPTMKSSAKGVPRGARGQAEMMEILERLANSAERLAQAAERLAEATLRSSSGSQYEPARQQETLEGAGEEPVVMIVDEGEEK